MKSDSGPKYQQHRWSYFLRFLAYSLLIVWATDHFFIHPSNTTHSQILHPSLELNNLASRLSEHVHYLASPALKGRRFGTSGNKAAEKYILNQFIEIGLSAPGPDKNRTQLISKSIGN